jgi:hypothetical protein
MNQLSPAEKAKELFNKMYQVDNILHEKKMDKYEAKQCALIAVEEILNAIKDIYCYDFDILNPYWKEVKTEIEKL